MLYHFAHRLVIIKSEVLLNINVIEGICQWHKLLRLLIICQQIGHKGSIQSYLSYLNV